MKGLSYIIKTIIKTINYDELSTKVGELSFFVQLSLFPFLLLFISIVAYIPEFKLNEYTGMIANVMPSRAFDVLSSVLVSAVNHRNFSFISMSFILTMWTSSRAIKALIKGMNKSYKVKETRSFIKILLISFLFTIILLILILISIFLLIYGEKVGHVLFKLIGLDRIFVNLWNVFRYTVSLLTTICIFVILYRYTPNKKLHIYQVVPGAIFSTFSWFIVSYVYSYYTNNWANYNMIYGSIAELIVLITWIYFISWVITIGYELNSRVYYRNKIFNKK